jgi:hypothetical protein
MGHTGALFEEQSNISPAFWLETLPLPKYRQSTNQIKLIFVRRKVKNYRDLRKKCICIVRIEKWNLHYSHTLSPSTSVHFTQHFTRFFYSVRKKVLWLHVQDILHCINDLFIGSFLLALPPVLQTHGNCWRLGLDCVTSTPSLQIQGHVMFLLSIWQYLAERCHPARRHLFEVFHGVWIGLQGVSFICNTSQQFSLLTVSPFWMKRTATTPPCPRTVSA